MGELIPLFPLAMPVFPGIVLPLQVFEPRYRRLVRDLLALPEGANRRFFGVTAIRQGWEVERIAPTEALYDVGCTARLRAVRPEPDGGFRSVTVGGDRFRLLDVVVTDDPPYLQAEVEWLAEEEAAEEAAARLDGLAPAPRAAGSADEPAERVADAVARGSLDVLVRNVRDLFIRYVTEVAALRLGWDDPGGDDPFGEGGLDPEEDDDAERVGARTAALLAAVADDPQALSYLVASAALLTPEDRQALLAMSATRRRLAAESRLLRRELTLLQTLGAVPVPLREFPAPTTVN
jgi:Lon protease-like protein